VFELTIVNFGTVPLGETSKGLITVKSIREDSITITAVGDEDSAVAETGCLPEVELATQGTCEIALVFTPRRLVSGQPRSWSLCLTAWALLLHTSGARVAANASVTQRPSPLWRIGFASAMAFSAPEAVLAGIAPKLGLRSAS